MRVKTGGRVLSGYRFQDSFSGHPSKFNMPGTL